MAASRRLVLGAGIVCTFLSGAARGQEYVWPTNASRYLTSAFGEFRARHFHGGIDIKTWGTTGFDVVATQQGWLTRMKVSPFGYGKVLYLGHPDGRTSVYAHLLRFAPKIQGLLEAEQERQGRFSVELFFRRREIPVAQGELIAFSGRSGIGALTPP